MINSASELERVDAAAFAVHDDLDHFADLVEQPGSNVAAFPVAQASMVEPTHEVPTTVDTMLVEILSYPRQHESAGEIEFQEWLGKKLHALTADAKGIIERMGKFRLYAFSIPKLDGKKSRTLFSCHCDTIDGNYPKGQRKKLTYDSTFGLIGLDSDSIGGSLGADDGVGVWIMLKMIEARVPGTYLFHRQEESGGQSAKDMARNEHAWLKKFDCSVAFDRPNTSEIITHQGGMECASMRFGLALAERLNGKGMSYSPSSRGVYTDNREYRCLISENVNIGVGYHGQHGRSEELDYAHANALLEACVKIDWDSLPVERDHTKASAPQAYNGSGMRWGGQMDFGGWKEHAARVGQAPAPKKKGGAKGKPDYSEAHLQRAAAAREHTRLLEDVHTMTASEMWDLASSEPEEAAAMLAALVRENVRLAADVEALELLLTV